MRDGGMAYVAVGVGAGKCQVGGTGEDRSRHWLNSDFIHVNGEEKSHLRTYFILSYTDSIFRLRMLSSIIYRFSANPSHSD